MVYLEAATERYSLKYVFVQIRETWHTEQRYAHITIIEKINIFILVMQNCLSHILKRFYQANFNSVFY